LDSLACVINARAESALKAVSVESVNDEAAASISF